jgi:serine/threonine protein kinase
VAAGTTGTLLADRYRVERRLGAGGMASVFLAADERLGRKVAIKRLHAEGPDDNALRFVREAKVGASLNHPNIVSVYDTVTDDEGVFLVMEYVEGETLRDAIARGPVPPEDVLRVLRGVAAALDHAHENGVVHRDVKPANILIGPDGRAKLADLGIASAAERTRITHSGTVLGTAPYLAPERLEGGAGGPAADVYALAAVAYEALSGHKAVEGKTPLEIAQRIVNGPAPDLAERWPDAPPDAGGVLRRGMATDPGERPASARALVDDLDRALAPALDAGPTRPTRQLAEKPRVAAPAAAAAAAEPRGGATPPPAPRPTPARAGGERPRWLIPAALAALAAVVLLVVLLGSGGGSGDKPSSSAARHAASSKGKAPSSKTAASSSQGGSSAQSTTAGDPAQTFGDFYTSSVGGNVDHAWSISTDRLHQQVGGRQSFQNGEASLKSIHFTRLETTSKTATGATVSFADTAVHQTFTDNCHGTGDLVPGGPSGWLLDHIDVTCTKAGGAQAAPPASAAPPGPAKKKEKAPKPKAQGKGGD